MLSAALGCTDDTGTQRDRLGAALATYRPFATRLADEGEHRPCAAEHRQTPLCEGLLEATDPRSEAWRRFLYGGGGRHFDDAYAAVVADLYLRAVGRGGEWQLLRSDGLEAMAGDDVDRLSDVATLQLARGEVADDLAQVLRSLETQNRLLTLTPPSPRLLFNRALALSWIPLPRQAVEAWTRYLDVEADDAWRREAEQRKSRMDALLVRDREPRVVDRCRRLADTWGGPTDPAGAMRVPEHEVQAVRIYVEGELLRRWGEAVEAGDRRLAASRLGFASVLVRALDSAGGDALVLRRSVERAAAATGPDAVTLARGHRLYGEALEAHEADEDSRQVAGLFAQAARLLEAAGSPFAAWPRFYLSVIAHHRPDYPAALAGLRKLRDELPAADEVVHAYVAWMLGLTLSKQARFDEALDHFRTGRALFVAAGESENVAAMDEQAALKWENLGRLDNAWRLHRAALAANPFLHKSRRIQNAYQGSGETLERQGRLELAALFFDEWVDEAERSKQALSRALAWEAWARVEWALGHGRRATEGLDRATAALRELKDPGEGRETWVHVQTTRSALVEERDPAGALAILEPVATALVDADLRLLLVGVRLRQARLHGRLGETAAQEAKLRAAIDEVRRQRNLIADPSRRVGYLDQSRHVMEEAVGFYLDAGQPRKAFLLSERMRALELRDEHQRRGIGGRLRSLPDVQRDLGEGATVLSYLLLPGRLVRFEVTQDSFRYRVQQIDAESLAGAVGTFMADVEKGDGVSRGALGNLLLPSALHREAPSKLLVVADGPLHDLLWAALPLPDGGELGDRVLPVVAPSVNVSLDLSLRARLLVTRRDAWTALLVGGYEHDQSAFPELPSLLGSAADLEAFRVPGVETTLLTGPRATRQRFLSMFPRFGNVFFNGHGLDRPRYLGGGLLMAPEGGDDESHGVLGQSDLLRQVESGDLHTEMVVLAACNTGRGAVSASEGAMSAARPFLALGVPRVAATLWPIDSASLEEIPRGAWASGPFVARAGGREHAKFQVYGALDVR